MLGLGLEVSLLESEFIGHLKLKLDLLGSKMSINSGHLRVRVMLDLLGIKVQKDVLTWPEKA